MASRCSLVMGIFLLLFSSVRGDAKGDPMRKRLHTVFSVECNNYFDWQTIGLMNSYRRSGHPGGITRLLSCTPAALLTYKGMKLAPTHVVPSMSRHPKTGDWYPAINKPAGVVHWLENSDEPNGVEWIVILDADMIIRHPIIPWELGAEKGRPLAALYGYLIGCDNILAKLHTAHPELCDKVGGLLAMHMDDLRALAPLWLSKTEEVRGDKEHWATNITGDIYGQGWISEMYGYSFGAAEVGLRHHISNDLMIYPGYVPREGTEPILLHYGLRFHVGNWSFSKGDHFDDNVAYDCNKLFLPPPYPGEIFAMESDQNKRRGLLLSIECINTLNEGLQDHHKANGCSDPPKSKYITFLTVWRKIMRKLDVSATSSRDNMNNDEVLENKESFARINHQLPATDSDKNSSKIHTLFSVECSTYFDWQTVGLMHSFEVSGQPGSITRLLSCTPEQLKNYKGMDLAPTHLVPSYSLHPLTNDWYPAINKPAAVLHWLNHVATDAEFVIILDADMILRKPVTPLAFGAERRHPVSAPYDYLIGCNNILAKLHTRYPEACDKVGGVIIMHIDDLREFAPLWLHKTEEVRADKAHWSTNITGDVYGQGWISEMYGYSFGAAELKLRHKIRNDIMLYPGYIPPKDVDPPVFHYGLEFSVGSWKFDKADWHEEDMTNICWKFFPDPPDPASLAFTDFGELLRDTLSIECVRTLNDALYQHHQRRRCPEPIKDNGLALSYGIKEEDLSETREQINNLEMTSRKVNPDMSILSRKPNGSVVELAGGLPYWMVVLWCLSVFLLLLVVYSVYSNQGRKQKHSKSKRRQSSLNLSVKERI